MPDNEILLAAVKAFEQRSELQALVAKKEETTNAIEISKNKARKTYSDAHFSYCQLCEKEGITTKNAEEYFEETYLKAENPEHFRTLLKNRLNRAAAEENIPNDSETAALSAELEAIDTGTENRPLRKLAEESVLRGDAERRTGVYSSVHEDSSTASTKQDTSSVEFPKRSNDKKAPIAKLFEDVVIYSIMHYRPYRIVTHQKDTKGEDYSWSAEDTEEDPLVRSIVPRYEVTHSTHSIHEITNPMHSILDESYDPVSRNYVNAYVELALAIKPEQEKEELIQQAISLQSACTQAMIKYGKWQYDLYKDFANHFAKFLKQNLGNIDQSLFEEITDKKLIEKLNEPEYQIAEYERLAREYIKTLQPIDTLKKKLQQQIVEDALKKLIDPTEEKPLNRIANFRNELQKTIKIPREKRTIYDPALSEVSLATREDNLFDWALKALTVIAAIRNLSLLALLYNKNYGNERTKGTILISNVGGNPGKNLSDKLGRFKETIQNLMGGKKASDDDVPKPPQ